MTSNISGCTFSVWKSKEIIRAVKKFYVALSGKSPNEMDFCPTEGAAAFAYECFSRTH